MVAPSPTPMDAASVSLLVSAAAGLAAEAPEAAEARWDALAGDDEAIDAEIAKYRAALSALSQRLRELGGFEPSSRGGSDDGDAAANGGAAGAAGAGGGTIEGVDGVEGVDYHLGSVDDLDPSEWHVPPHCIPIHANVTTYDWSKLIAAFGSSSSADETAAATTATATTTATTTAAADASTSPQQEQQQQQPPPPPPPKTFGDGFDAIMMDPPWQLATANPTRGVALGYSQLTDADIENLPIPRLQPRKGSYLFVWVINAKYKFCLDLFDKWGYDLVDEIVWVKSTVNRRLAKSHGYYLQHAKEVCLVGVKRDDERNRRSGGGGGGGDAAAAAAAALGSGAAAAAAAKLSSGAVAAAAAPAAAPPLYPAGGVGSDIIFSERRGQSQKPEEIYQLVEAVCPGGSFLEIFGRKNNLRDFWVTVGNEVTGTGPPREDATVIAAGGRIPGAVYGAAGR